MNENLFRPQFNQMDNTEKQALMKGLAARYGITFLSLHTFDRWGERCTLFPVTPSPGAGTTFSQGSIRTAGRTWTICFRNGKWSVTRRN